MTKVERYFSLAKLVAKRVTSGDARRQYRLGAVGIRRDGTVVKSSNIPTRVPVANAHAEARLVKKLDAGATVYVVRVLRDGTLTHARPCPSCIGKMLARGVRRCYYSISENEHGVIQLC